MVKVIPVIQEVYKNILYDTDASFSTILKYSNCNDILSMIREDERNFSEYGLKMLNSVKNAESCLLFNLTVFAELGNVKNNLILVSLLIFMKNSTLIFKNKPKIQNDNIKNKYLIIFDYILDVCIDTFIISNIN